MFREMRESDKSYHFSKAVRYFTPVRSYIKRSLNDIEGFDFNKEDKEKLNLFFGEVFKAIDSIYEKDGFDIVALTELIRSKEASIKNFLGVEGLKKKEKKEGEEVKTKFLYYNEVSDIESHRNGKFDGLVKIGYSKLDKFIEIHVDAFYKKDQENLGSELIREDLERVATTIVDFCPETAAVIGRSWLLDTPPAERFGFIKIENDQDIQEENDWTTWFQFVDRDGQINQKRFSKFCENGRLPFKSTVAYIPVEEFLKKYLPKIYRPRKVILKEIDSEKEAFIQRMIKITKKVKQGWEKVIKGEISFESFISDKDFNDVLDDFGVENRTLFLDFFKEIYDKKVSWKDSEKYQSDNLTMLIKEVNERRQRDLYKEREIIIE